MGDDHHEETGEGGEGEGGEEGEEAEEAEEGEEEEGGEDGEDGEEGEEYAQEEEEEVSRCHDGSSRKSRSFTRGNVGSVSRCAVYKRPCAFVCRSRLVGTF